MPIDGKEKFRERLGKARNVLKPPPKLNLVQWADKFRFVSLSATPGRWRTSEQPVAFGPMLAVTEADTHTVSMMAGTQVAKSELLVNTAYFFIHQEPSPILFVQPTQEAAEGFSKERFSPDLDRMPELREIIKTSKAKDSENTIRHKAYPGGPLDFVGANSPTDLASRPKRVILCDEIDKYPPSAGAEGDPLKLAEERSSTYRAFGRSKSVRTCSPTEKGKSRIGREYAASDRRKCFLACPHCGHEQVLAWANVQWSRGPQDEHLPETAGIACISCGVIWSEQERHAALGELEFRSDHGWRQTREFYCCGEKREPDTWDDQGRACCPECGERSAYGGHAGFHVSKLYSKRHRLSDIVREFLDAQGDPELLKKFVNTALAELWEAPGETLDGSGLIARAELYGPDDLPNEVSVITGFCDVQGDRLEVQLFGWGKDEEAWPFLYEVIHQDPAQPMAWKELDALALRTFRRRDGKILRLAALGIDTGGHHGAQVYDFCRKRRGRRIFACKGIAGKKPIWPTLSTRSKSNDPLWLIGVDSAKDAIYARLKIQPSLNGEPKPGFIHFPATEGFGPQYYEQLTSERRETRKRMGQPYIVWVLPDGKRNEALDTAVGALAVRRSLPRHIERGLEYDIPPPDDLPPSPPKKSIASMLAGAR
jgi:phage terminase large subunit GpA-like protein